MQKYIYSFLIGILFFLLSYFLVKIPLIWSILIAVLSFFAGRLIFQDNTMKFSLEERNTKSTLAISEKNIQKILGMLPKIDQPEIVSLGKEICSLSKNILKSLSKYPRNIHSSYTFLNYYLPVTEDLVKRYEEIENQNLTSPETKEVTTKIITLMGDIKVAFENFQNQIYNNELVDMNAEIEVFKNVLKSDGLLEDCISKGVKK